MSTSAVIQHTLTGPPPLDGMVGALLSDLAPLWPALAPWLAAGAIAAGMGIATEIVVRELHRRAAEPPRR